MRTANQIIASILWVVGIIMLCTQSTSIIGALFFVPFVLGPHAATHLRVMRTRNPKAQIVLMVALLAYFAWFVFVYMDIFYIHVDAQGAIALLFVGIYALPVLALLWLAAARIEKKQPSGSGSF